jgi:integrase
MIHLDPFKHRVYKIMSKQSKPERDTKSAYGMHTTKYPKSDERHWQDRVFHQRHTSRSGATHEDKTYSIQISHKGSRKTIQLHTANKKEAGKKSRDIYLSLKANGWEATLEKYNPKAAAIIKGSTVGDLIRVYSELADVPPKTAASYAGVLRSVVAEIKGISGDKRRFDHVTGGADEWRAKIDAVKLSDITQAKVQKWKLAYVKSRGTDPLKEKSAKRTVNSYIRYCRSLFSVKVMPYLLEELELPEKIPFHDVALYKRESMKYTSSFDIVKLSMKARDELMGIEKDQQWLIYLLAASAGLRRNEIDKLTWRQINFDNNTISVAATKYFKPKSENSGTLVSIDSDLTDMLRGYRARIKGEFVIEETVAPRLKSKIAHYRANRHFNALNIWLKENGVDDQKPLHTLRKEAGSLVNEKDGLYAASHFLRHADIQVTAAHYVDNKKTITSGLGAIMAGKVEPITKGKEKKHG